MSAVKLPMPAASPQRVRKNFESDRRRSSSENTKAQVRRLVQRLPTAPSQAGSLPGLPLPNRRRYSANRGFRDLDDLGGPLSLSAGSTIGDALAGLGRDRLSELASATDPFTTHHEEERTRERYEMEVTQYLSQCRETLPGAVDALRGEQAGHLVLRVQNLTDSNFAGLLVRLHVEGDVDAYHGREEFWLKNYHPQPPRIWGPWTERRLAHADFATRQAVSVRPMPHVPRPRPEIVNGGSARIACLPVDLRPREGVVLSNNIALSALATVAGSISCTWTATATNVDGQAEGRFTLPISRETLDFTRRLRHGR